MRVVSIKGWPTSGHEKKKKKKGVRSHCSTGYQLRRCEMATIKAHTAEVCLQRIRNETLVFLIDEPSLR